MNRFPMLPEWLVFFITSRPEGSVQFRLKKYNPCVKICAGHDTDHHNFYQQHEQDIQTFLEKRIDCSRLFCKVEDISKKCHGLFLYAHYIVEELRLSMDSGKKLNQLSDLFPGDIDDFFLQNFKRVYDQVGHDLFKKLFGCAVVAPSPLPVAIIYYILVKENSNHDEQQVIDAVSQFVVLRTSDQTLAFLHNLIPAWLTDRNKTRKLFIDKNIAGEYLRDIFVEILSHVVIESRSKCPIIDDPLKDYVSRVAVRFLCQNSETDTAEYVFSCLTSYHFIERRMIIERIEIYHLLEDLKLAVGRFSLQEVKKKEILQEIVKALESNVLILLECPHLFHSCIRNASNTVQEAVLIPQVSAPWLEWNVCALPATKISGMRCFATSPAKRSVAAAKARSILFYDTFTAETVKGPFEVSDYLFDDINQLEFSPDGKFIFFGRLDKWFSVERERVEEFPQFSGNSHVYSWGVLTRDGKSILSKRNFLFDPSTCKGKSCLFNILSWWALKEIKESRDDELTIRFSYQTYFTVPGLPIKRLFERLGIRKHQITTWETPYDPSCHYCCRLKELTEPNQEPSLVTVRQLVIELYSFIFHYQVWDLQTGVPVLQQIFSQGAQLNLFSYLCHVAFAYSGYGQLFDLFDKEKAMSVCNIAAVTAVCCTLGARFYFGDELEMMRERKKIEQLRKQRQELVVEGHDSEHTYDLYPNPLATTYLFKRHYYNEAFEFGFYTELPKGFQDLIRDSNREIRTCLSPEMKWTVEADGSLKLRSSQTGKLEHTISKVERFWFTNDDDYLVYSCEGSLHALSLQTGKVLTSVRGCNLFYFTRERQVGYLFRSNTDEKAIFLTHLFSPFRFVTVLPEKFVGNCIMLQPRFVQAILLFLSVSSDCFVTLWQIIATASKEAILLINYESLLIECGSLAPHIENCVLSPDGKLIAVQQGAKVKLHSLEKSEVTKFPSIVFQSKDEFTVPCFAFSADSTLLLFCINDSRVYPHFYVWDVEKNVISASFKSPGLLTAECCCLSSSKQELVLCGEYQIEIWEYAKHPRLFARFAVEKPFNNVKFGHCIVSLDNHLLACCIANTIIVNSFHASDINLSKRVLRGHLGRIEFCRFLKVNRYLISYGVDGMVFLWDLVESKAVGFARITQGQDSIVSMAVSPEEDRAVCFTSCDRVYVIRLRGLGSRRPLTAVKTPKEETATTRTNAFSISDSNTINRG